MMKRSRKGEANPRTDGDVSEEDAPVRKWQRAFSPGRYESGVTCWNPRCADVTFITREAYDQHWAECHIHQCLECSLNFPSAHLLDLHITEQHDPFFEIKVSSAKATVGRGVA